MDVTVSCAGRFHAFHLVEQLYARNALSRFITTTLNDRLIPNRALPARLKHDPAFQQKVRTIPLPEYLCYAVRSVPAAGAQSLAYFAKDNLYDLAARQEIPNCDLFVGWADQSLFQLREARSRGARTIIERGSSHIVYQQELIDEERKRLGMAASASQSGFDQRLIEKQLKEYHEADYIMVPSEFAQESFVCSGFNASKVLKVPYGVDIDLFHTAARPLSRPGKLRLLFIGPIGVQKGIRYLLEAIRDLRQRNIEIELTVIGKLEQEFRSWWNASPLRSLVATHIEFVPNDQLPRYFASHDAFCLPSIQEGLALVVGEAMASGLPVVATKNTGASEFLRQGLDGYIVPPFDAPALASALEQLAADPEQSQRMGAAAAERMKEFTWQNYGDRVLAAYELVLSNTTTTKEGGEEIANYYDEYWNREKGWTPSHKFSDAQLNLHFDDLLQPTDTVLDVGCGDADNYQAWLVKKVAKLSAVDISKSGIEHAKQLGMDAIVHDFSLRFPYEDNTFNAAICIEVLEHLYDPKFCVSEVFRILKPGGIFITSVPNNGYFRERLKMLTRAELSTSITDFGNEWRGAHIRFYSVESFTRMLGVTGFAIERVRSNGDASIFDGLDAFGGYITQQVSSGLRRVLPRALRLGFLEDLWPSMFAPHMVVWARKPL